LKKAGTGSWEIHGNTNVFQELWQLEKRILSTFEYLFEAWSFFSNGGYPPAELYSAAEPQFPVFSGNSPKT
jgi:hypothetical protein